MKYLQLIFLLFFITSCATAYDVSLNSDHMDAEKAHDVEQRGTITAQSAAISSLKATSQFNDDPRDKALASMTNILLAREIASLKYEKSSIKAPRLNTDNIEPITKATIGLAPFVVVSKVVSDTIDEVGNETYSSNGGDLTVEKSEVHTTTAGDKNEVSSTYDRESTKTEDFVETNEEEK